MDIASAYCMVPVHPGDRPLLAVQWAGKIFFDTRLPFGLRSAPKCFYSCGRCTAVDLSEAGHDVGRTIPR